MADKGALPQLRGRSGAGRREEGKADGHMRAVRRDNSLSGPDAQRLQQRLRHPEDLGLGYAGGLDVFDRGQVGDDHRALTGVGYRMGPEAEDPGERRMPVDGPYQGAGQRQDFNDRDLI